MTPEVGQNVKAASALHSGMLVVGSRHHVDAGPQTLLRDAAGSVPDPVLKRVSQ